MLGHTLVLDHLAILECTGFAVVEFNDPRSMPALFEEGTYGL
jgi:hypothetical protein